MLRLSTGLSRCFLKQTLHLAWYACRFASSILNAFVLYAHIFSLNFSFLNQYPSTPSFKDILYLQWHVAPWGSSGRPHHQTPQESSLLQPENSCPVCPICGGSAWPLHVLPQGPGPAGPDGPSAAGSQTGDS